MNDNMHPETCLGVADGKKPCPGCRFRGAKILALL